MGGLSPLLGLEPVLFRQRVHRLTVYTLFEDTSARNGQLADVWSSYIQRLLPDAVYIPNGLEHLKPQLQKLLTGYIGEVDYTKPVPWRGSPALHSLLAKRNPDGSPVACGPSYLVDVERSSEAPPVSELQRIARFGTVSEVPIGSPQFLGVEQQLWDLVHTVPPASGQGLVDWLLDIPDPDPLVPSPPYLAQGGAIHSAITLNHTGISPGSRSFPPDHRDYYDHLLCPNSHQLLLVNLLFYFSYHHPPH